jgi:hypothetical protein
MNQRRLDRDLFRVMTAMQSMSWLLSLVAIASVLTPWAGAATQPLAISEIVAENDAGLVDEDGERVDWIEIQNLSSAAVQLANYCLTDDPDDLNKWSFPDHLLAPGAFLVVFWSG